MGAPDGEWTEGKGGQAGGERDGKGVWTRKEGGSIVRTGWRKWRFGWTAWMMAGLESREWGLQMESGLEARVDRLEE